jgi:hypothetical protein
MRRFKHEEKLLGPNEQAALNYVIDILVAKQEQAEARGAAKTAPEGWKLVPVELTQEMKKAWVVSLTPTDAWAAMLEAGPQGSAT